MIKKSNKQAQVIFGLIAGFFGGISGQWGPPLVIFLSQNLKVGQFIGFQGIVYSIGSVSLLFGHLQSGVLTKDLTLLSLPLVFICCLGQLIGYMVRTFQNIDGIKKFSLICLFAFEFFLSYEQCWWFSDPKSVIFEIKLVFAYLELKLPTNKYINYTIRHTIKKNTWRSDDETNINLNKFNLYGN